MTSRSSSLTCAALPFSSGRAAFALSLRVLRRFVAQLGERRFFILHELAEPRVHLAENAAHVFGARRLLRLRLARRLLGARQRQQQRLRLRVNARERLDQLLLALALDLEPIAEELHRLLDQLLLVADRALLLLARAEHRQRQRLRAPDVRLGHGVVVFGLEVIGDLACPASDRSRRGPTRSCPSARACPPPAPLRSCAASPARRPPSTPARSRRARNRRRRSRPARRGAARRPRADRRAHTRSTRGGRSGSRSMRCASGSRHPMRTAAQNEAPRAARAHLERRRQTTVAHVDGQLARLGAFGRNLERRLARRRRQRARRDQHLGSRQRQRRVPSSPESCAAAARCTRDR